MRYHLSKNNFLSICLSLCLTILPLSAQSCTLYAATGQDYVAGGGTLVAKNRDYKALGSQTLEQVNPSQGYRYYKLTGVIHNNDRITVCGINEQGLYVGNSVAGGVDQELKNEAYYFRDNDNLNLTEHLLCYYATVDEALAREDIFKGVSNLILADRTKIAIVELLPDGTHSIQTTQNGILYHTNHYVTPEGSTFNKKIGLSSSRRYYRIGELLNNSTKPLCLQDFIKFSEDQAFDRDTSIYRLGRTPQSIQTLAVFIAHIPPAGSPDLYIKYRVHPNEQGQEKIVGPERYSF